MVIERRKYVNVEMSKIKIGEVFSIYDGQDLYMRTTDSYCENDSYDNCVNLETGQLDYIGPDNIVRKESAKLVIE